MLAGEKNLEMYTNNTFVNRYEAEPCSGQMVAIAGPGPCMTISQANTKH